MIGEVRGGTETAGEESEDPRDRGQEEGILEQRAWPKETAGLGKGIFRGGAKRTANSEAVRRDFGERTRKVKLLG